MKVYAEVNAVPLPPAPILSHSCFVAGTLVLTLDGRRPIESIRTGDQVLSRDVATGALAFRPVLAPHHNPPDVTLKVSLDGGDAVVVSRFHAFWLAGRGWALARDLKPGDVLRTLDGTARIAAIEPRPVQPVFNLDIAEFRTYFVGDSALLVHDNSAPRPTRPRLHSTWSPTPADQTATPSAASRSRASCSHRVPNEPDAAFRSSSRPPVSSPSRRRHSAR